MLAFPARMGLRPVAPPTPEEHVVQFYDDEDFLSEIVARFLAPGIASGEPVIVIATEPHRHAFCERLEAKGLDVHLGRDSGQLSLLDARETLSTFMVDGEPQWEPFRVCIGGLIDAKRTKSQNGRIRAYGEMVDLLWRDGNPQGAIHLEEMWNDLGRLQQFSLLCAYGMGNFYKEADGANFEKICRVHTHVVPDESYPKEEDPDTRLRKVSLLQQRARALESEIEHRRELEKALREALAQRRRAEEKLRASQQELVDFVENAAECMHWVGPDGTILWANRAELEMLGYSREEYVGRNIAEFHADQAAIEDILTRLCRNETLHDYEAKLRRKDGSVKHVLIHSNVYFRDGKFVHTRCFTRDVTERKRLEQELLRQNDDLSRALRFSEMFVGILGHDLRNPLSAIMTAASLLARRSDSDKIVKPAGRIVSSAARMGRMIDQILDFTRIRLGKGIPLHRQRIDVAEICRLVLDEVEASDARRVQLEVVGDPVGLWDGDRLSQLVSNLLGNALAHGKQGAPVLIRVDASDIDGIALEVHNAGAIPEDVRAMVFEPFRNGADRKQERSSGLGLGLFISQQIVVAHSGTIDAASSEEEGTRFLVRLPRNAHTSAPAFSSAESG